MNQLFTNMKYLYVLIILLLGIHTKSFSKVRQVIGVTSGNYIYFDLNGDGNYDFYQLMSMLTNPNTTLPCSAPQGGTYVQSGFNIDQTLYPVNSKVTFMNSPSLLTLNQQIGSTSSISGTSYFVGTALNLMYTPACNGVSSVGPIYNGPYTADGFISFKFIQNGLNYFGWIQISNKSIVKVAFEDIPGFPINTGDLTGYMSYVFNATANIIKGKVFVDNNSNCIYDTGEKGVPNIMVYTTIGNYAGMTDSVGNYEIFVVGGTSSYQLDVDVTPIQGVIYTKVCPAGTLTASFSGNNQTVSGKNFSIADVTSCANLKVSVTSDRRRRCFRNTTTVQYENFGTMASSSATVKVIMPQYVKAISSIPAWNNQSGDTLFYNVGIIASLGNGVIKITDSVICGDPSITGLTVCTEAIISPKVYCTIPIGWDQSDLLVTGFCQDSLFYASINNAGNDMQTPVSYRIFLDGTMVKTEMIELTSHQTINFEIPCHGKALRIEVDQTPNHPEIKMRSLSFEGCGNLTNNTVSYDVINQNPTNQGGFAESSNCQQIRDSYDPNAKEVIPVGFDTDNKIAPDGNMQYTIRFQNTGSASAYTVVLVDTLDSNLDLASIEVLGASHSYKLEVTGKNNPRLVWIFGGINLPNSSVNEPASHGYITFKVAQKPGLSAGTIIKNKAYIYFDYNVAVLTNLVSQKIYIGYPKNLLTVTTSPGSKNSCTNDNITLTAGATGYGNLNYQWYKDNIVLSNNNSSSITINNVSVSDIGNYKCRIENELDTIYTNNASVNVNVIPNLIITDPVVACNSNVDITNSFRDGNNTTGVISYWTDATATASLSDPNTVSSSGTYYIKKLVGGICGDIKPVVVSIKNNPDLVVTDPTAVCNSTVDITNSFTDNNNTTGTISYWLDATATTNLLNANAIVASGTFYIEKVTSDNCKDIKPVTVSITTCTNVIEELYNLYNIKISPNPTVDKISIENIIPSTISVSNNIGKELFQKSVQTGKNEIDLTNLSSGTYIITFTLNERNYSVPVIKQ